MYTTTVQGHISQMPETDDLRTRSGRVIWSIICKAIQFQRHSRTKDVTGCYYTFDVGRFVGSVSRQAVT